MNFSDLPTVVRRSFDAYLQRFQDENPGANLRRTERIEGPNPVGDYTLSFEDATSGAKYEVIVNVDGAVFGTRELA